MERIRINSLKVGQTFSKSVFSSAGQKLLNPGVPLSNRHVQAMQRTGDLEVLLAEGVEELVAAGILDQIDSTNLAVGQKVNTDVLTPTGNVVVEAQEEVEAHHLDALAASGSKAFAQKKPADQRRARILMSDAIAEDLLSEVAKLDLRVEPAQNTKWIQEAPAVLWPNPQELGELRNASVEHLRQLYARIEAGLTVPLSEFENAATALLNRLSSHPTRFTQLALLCPRREDYLPDHAYTVTVLAMAIAAQLQWSEDDVRRVGLAGLLYDLGMLLVPERIRTGACTLTDIDRSRVQRHPVFTLSMMQFVEGVTPICRLAGLQHHERENGSGYPRGTRRESICDFARVLSVADSFAAATEPRHYRSQKLPYIAMEESLRSASAMSFWKPAVRALVQAAGLFPVGSYVKLSDNKNAMVIASNPRQLDRPTVQTLDVEGRAQGPAIDLTKLSVKELSVVRPIAGAAG